ncbi:MULTISPECIES: hypothetical protein [Streptomyces]|uniref:hypothetical protein n=1 Tax=Streptomyces TaxID=1883 RepID=UPI001670220A|nr:hypothetical protein [Streptomyces ruber]
MVYLIDSAGNSALSAGLYGDPGQYRVSHCYDTNPGRNNSDYECDGVFTPHDDQRDAVHVHLKDGSNYKDGATVEMRRGLDSDTYRPTGLWPVLGELWKVGLSFGVLMLCVSSAVAPRGVTRRGAGRSSREVIADYSLLTAMVGVGVVLLDGAVALLMWLIDLIR